MDRPVQADRKKREKQVRLQLDADLRSVAATAPGRAVLWRLITNATGVFSSSFDLDARVHAFNEGRRSVGLALIQQLQRVAPGSYLEMVQERTNADLMELQLATRGMAAETEDAEGDRASSPG